MDTYKLGLFFFALVALSNAAKPFEVELLGDFKQFYMYYATIGVGVPSKPFTVVVLMDKNETDRKIDTGSSDLLIPSVDCKSCYGGDPKLYYNGSDSVFAAAVPCKTDSFECDSCYGDEQCAVVAGFVGMQEYVAVWEDIIALTPDGSPDGNVANAFGAIYNLSFGSIPKKYHSMKRNVEDDDYPEGILGLASKSLSAFGGTPVMDALVKQGVQDIFSICFNSVGGMMMIGGVGPWSDPKLIKYLPMKEDQGFYALYMLDLAVNGESIGITKQEWNKTHMIVDTGTPLPTLPPAAYKALRSVIMSNCSQSNLPGVCTGVPAPNATLFDGVCYNLTESEIAEFPTLEWIFQGVDNTQVTLNLPPSQYLQEQYFCENGGVGIGIDVEDDFTIIGAEMLQLYHTVYDRSSNTMGFAPKGKCVKSS